ncbi:MAG: hypothetical protein JSV26_04055 [bacterium]|nr:MAG: hypothetical protein JSV26_04055 [bacterium]
MTDLGRLFRGEHPFISSPGKWILVGHGMTGGDMKRIPMEGQIEIIHGGGKILTRGSMNLVSHVDQVSFSSQYEMTPTEIPEVLSFFQANPEVGDLRGQVVAFDDRIISSYRSGDGALVGTEVFLRVSDRRYLVTGSLTRGDRIVNLWKLDMVRPSSGSGSEGIVEAKE